MKQFIYSIILFSAFAACDPNRIYDQNRNIPNDSWFYKEEMPFDVQITDTQKWYTVYVNLRVNSDYKYNNVFLWLETKNPDGESDKRRVEIRLADEHGKWLGAGLGDIYDYQFPVLSKIKFPKSGFYRFNVVQNMRDDSLRNVKSVGIRVEEFADGQ